MNEGPMLPPPVERYLRVLFMQRTQPLLLSFDADWSLRAVQGDAAHFGIDVDHPDRGLKQLQDLFTGLPPHEDMDIAFVELSGGRSAHIHRIADGDGFHVLLLDADDAHARQRAQQQLGNEAVLAGHAKSKAIGRLQDIRSELERQRAALEEADALKNALIATLGHEFRTPLTSIFGYAKLLDRRFGVNGTAAALDGAAPALNAIRRNAIHLYLLAQNLLQYGRGDSAVLLNPVRIDLDTLAGDLDLMFRTLAEDGKIALSVRVKRDDTAAPVFDDLCLRQILANLLSNAVRYTERGEIVMELHWRDGRLRIDVRDSGIGIAPEFHQSIFKPFNRVGRNSSKGAGLGLAAVRSLVEQMHGELRLDSQLGQGTRVVVELPSQESAAMDEQSAQCFNDCDVLVVDDDPDIAHLLEAVLLDLGSRVRIAENATDAIEAALKQPPDLLLIDVELPGLSGNAAVFQLRSHGYRGRIVTLSAGSTQQAHDAALRAGADHYMTKPLDIEQLISVMQRAVGSH
jgi:signal transduction histidine kinase/ActR/RegA family two-component response regulator